MISVMENCDGKKSIIFKRNIYQKNNLPEFIIYLLFSIIILNIYIYIYIKIFRSVKTKDVRHGCFQWK